jgi:Carboxypeptidase regulatory-like domain
MRGIRLAFVLLAALVAVAALSTAGCGSSSGTTATPPATTSPAASSGIVGLMTEVGGITTGPRPVTGVRIEVHQGGATGQTVGTAESGADGAFRVDLPPGRYTVVPVALGDEAVQSASVTVAPGKWVNVSVGFSVR